MSTPTSPFLERQRTWKAEPVPSAPDEVFTSVARVDVLWLAKGLGPGGMEQLLVAHARAADHRFFRYQTAYLRPDKTHLVAALEAAGVETTCLRCRRSWDLRWLAHLRGRLRSSRPAIVHCHSPLVAALARLTVKTLPRSARPALISTEHNTWDSFGSATRFLNRVTFDLDDDHLAVSEPVRASMPPSKQASVTTVVHGIDLDGVSAQRGQRIAVRRELGLPHDAVVVGTVANYRAQKDYPNLLESARRVLDVASNVWFIAVGQGPLEAEIMARHQQLRLGDRFRLLGYRPDATRIMSGFDVFTLASIHEGLPVAFMEARALGLPVVVTRVGGLPEHVEHGVDGLLVEPRDPDELADAILRVSADEPARLRMGAASARRAAAYDAIVATRIVEAHYRSLVTR